MANVNLDRINELAEVVGTAAALRLVAWYDGRTVYVPTSTDNPNHLLRRILADDEAFSALVKAHGGNYIALPAINLDALKHAGIIYRLSARGISAPDLATLCGISPGTVNSVRNQLRIQGFPAIADLLPEIDEVAA